MSRTKCCTVRGGNVLIFGDLHISSSFTGQHKNYLYECYNNMELILKIAKESKASAVIFLGDLVGVNEKNIRDRQVLMRTQTFFIELNRLTKGNVFSVKGNHDMGDFTDFDFFEGLRYIKNPKYIDYFGVDDNGNESFEVRFHLVNYGDETLSLDLASTNNSASDVVLGHCDYYIEGVTNWYSKGSEVELNKLSNFQGVSLVFSGHIHTPSDEILYTNLPNGDTIGLFYLGSPSRVTERFDDCWYLSFNYVKSSNGSYATWSTDYDAHFMELDKADEVFYPKEAFVDDEDYAMSEREVESSRLTDIVKEIIEGRITSGNLFHQIDIVPGVSEEVKSIAKKYLEMASNVE